MSDAFVLSKTRLARGLQCPKLLWWGEREPAAPELAADAAQAAPREAATLRVRRRARGLFPGGVTICDVAPEPGEAPPEELAAAVAATRAAIAGGATTLFGAAFAAGGGFAVFDVLRRDPDAAAWVATTVKASLRVKDSYVDAVAHGLRTLRAAGIVVARVELMHLDRDCRHAQLDGLFVTRDLTAQAEARLDRVAAASDEARAVAAQPALPHREVGAHCRSPAPCPFRARCSPPLPADHVSRLYQWSTDGNEGSEAPRSLHDVPPAQLSPVQRRQQRALAEGRVVVEPGLGAALRSLKRPLAYLDFETLMAAMPAWPGCRPYQNVPVQFSCHREGAGGALEHAAFLSEGAEDPRPALARALIAATDGAATILAYHAPFERDCILHLIDCCPELEAPLRAVLARLADLLPIVRNHVYHPDFAASFSIKRVLPALVPGLSYAGLAIGDGLAASVALEELLLGAAELDAAGRASRRAALLEYCALDTTAMVELVRALQDLASGS